MREQSGVQEENRLLGPDLPLQYGNSWPKLGFPFMKGNMSRSFINCEMNAVGQCGEHYLSSIHDPLQQVFGCENPRKTVNQTLSGEVICSLY